MNYELTWKNGVAIRSDGATAMRLATQNAQVANEDCMETHCHLHREALASEEFPSEPREILSGRFVPFVEAI